MSAILYSTDLFFSSRITAAAESAGISMQVVADASALLGAVTSETSLALLDLTAGPVTEELVSGLREKAPGIRLTAFGPHVATNKLSAAASAGCDAVLTRGQFDQQLPHLFQ